MPGNRAAVGISVPATRGRGRESLGGCRLVGTSQLTGRVDWREKNATWAVTVDRVSGGCQPSSVSAWWGRGGGRSK
ncbi:hypothetical protein HYQ46_008926 [Verticillium longisporum]|nr:hypothetical protein HYQ46_008926 [Verticillium longisporum]